MPKVPVYDKTGQTVGEIELNDAVFGAPVNHDLVHQAVRVHLANGRVGTASTKTRAEVRGGGRKPWRQKGLGRARHGSRRSPIWRGGGIVFGPKPRDFSLSMPKKARRAAIRSALSSKVQDGELVVLDSFALEEPKTREVVTLLNNLKLNGNKVMLLTGKKDENVEKSARNIPGVKAGEARMVNVYDLLRYRNLILTRDAVETIEEVLG